MIDFNNLYYKVYPWVRWYIINRGGSEDDAKDIFQDGLIVLLLKRDIDFTYSVNAFLYGVCKNLWLSHIAKKRQRIQYSTISINRENRHLYTYNRAFEQRSQYSKNSELIAIVNKHINTFCETDKQMFNMYVNNKPYKDIAKKMNVKPAYVRKRICMCKSRLTTFLKYDPYFKKFFV